MTKISNDIGRRFVARAGAVCAAWAVLTTPALGQIWGGEEGGPEVNVTDYGTVDLAVQDTDLAQVLEMLSIQGRKNIITSKNVSATVSANLYDVTFYEALDAILSVNGYAYHEEGNFIYVLTQEEMAEMEAASRRTESRIFELEYLSAGDASEFIAPLLSEVGKASARGDVQTGFQPDISDGGADGYAYNAKLVVNDYADNLDEIGALLAELDTPPQQVLIEASILQTTLDETNAYGVDFSIIADLDFIDLTDPLSPVNNLLNGDDPSSGFQPDDNEARAIQSTVGNTRGPGGFKVGVMSDEISVFLKLLDEVTDLSVLARPKIMALNRQRAEVLVGARVGYLSTTATQTTTTQTVQFLDTGIHLTFRPFISKNGMIRMELSPSVSEASLRTVTDAQGLQVTIPDELTNEMTTNVRVKDGQTLVLGGLFRESTKVTQRQVPFLGDIPIVGAAFTGQDDTVDRDEIIFLITPSIIHDSALWDAGDATLAYTDAVRVGARAGLLLFSRDKVTSNYNQRATNAFRDGDLDLALHWANTSLGANPNQPQIIKLREELSGKRERAYDAGIMERALRSVLGALPKEKVHLPREIVYGGGGGSRQRALNWLPNTGSSSQRRSTPTHQQPPPPRDDEPWPQPADQGMSGDDEGHDDNDGGTGPVSSRWDAGDGSVTREVPRAFSTKGFWQAGRTGAGFDDPAWDDSSDFVTFDEMLEVVGTAGGDQS
jgi:type IV pilus assembly protein PilQ